jgi:hypothetical protein
MKTKIYTNIVISTFLLFLMATLMITSKADAQSVTLQPVPVSCAGGATGAVVATNVVGLTPPYTYYWSNGQNSSIILDVAAGDYSVTVTDAESQKVYGTATVSTIDANSSPKTIIENSSACYSGSGQIIYVPVIVRTFNNVGSISFKITFDTTLFHIRKDLISYEGFPGEWNAGTTGFRIYSPAPGVLFAAYFGQGFSLDDDAVLLTLAFEYVGTSAGGSTSLVWSSNVNDNQYGMDLLPQYPLYCNNPVSDYFHGGTVTVNAHATTAEAGPAQNLCDTYVATLAGNSPSVGAGAWSVHLCSDPCREQSECRGGSMECCKQAERSDGHVPECNGIQHYGDS